MPGGYYRALINIMVGPVVLPPGTVGIAVYSFFLIRDPNIFMEL